MNTDNRRVLALLPHPDDIEILCAGTLVRLREAGCEIHIATMTPGDKGSAVLTREEISAVRREEARRAAELQGAATYTCLEFGDLEIVFDNATRRQITALVRKVNPGIVFTTTPVDYMFDHIITSQLVRDACFNAGCKNYDAGSDDPATTGVPYLYYTDPLGGVDSFGNAAPLRCIVDISAQIDLKAEALACHESQRAWLRRQHGMDDYIESMKRWSARRGAQIGAAFGEGFSQHLGHPHPEDDVLCELVNAVAMSGA